MSGPKNHHSTSLVILIIVAYFQGTDGKFYDLQEDGSILCETREDCPDDIPDKANSTVLEFRCAKRVAVGDEHPHESPNNEKIIITEDWYLNQLICGEETVNICCTQFAEPDQCGGFDKENCDEDNAEVYGGTKPPIHIASSSAKVGVTVPPKLRAKCDRQECKRRKRVRRRGVIDVCCELVIVRGNFACPPRKKGNCREL